MKIQIASNRRAAVESKIARLARKAEKYGNEKITIEFSKPFLEKRKDSLGYTYSVSLMEVTVNGEAPIVESGWKFKARVELDEPMNLFHGEKVDNRFRTHKNVCEHCQKSRSRKDVFVFEKDNEQIAVGRTCLNDFTGSQDPKMIVAYNAFFETFKSEDEETEGFSGATRYYDPFLVAKITAFFVRTEGWVSKAAAMTNNTTPTIALVEDYFAGRIAYSKINFTNEDQDLANKTVEFFRDTEQKFSNDYLLNLHVIYSKEAIKEDRLPIAVSAVNVVRNQEKNEENSGEFVGNVKERLRNMKLTLLKETYISQSNYGDVFLYTFEDDAGNTLVWFTAKKDIQPGTKITCDATVKDHKEYKGTKQTVLTRVKEKEKTN